MGIRVKTPDVPIQMAQMTENSSKRAKNGQNLMICYVIFLCDGPVYYTCMLDMES